MTDPIDQNREAAMAESEVVTDGGGEGRGTNPGPIRADWDASLRKINTVDNVKEF